MTKNILLTARLSLMIILALLLTNCSRHGLIDDLTQNPIKQKPPSDNASIKISEAADAISHSLGELARIQEEATPAKYKRLPYAQTRGMLGSASVDWAGPIEPLVKQISAASHYRLRVLGRRPALPILINLKAQNRPLASLLRDVDYQAGARADILVFPTQKTIELRYART